MTGETPEVRRLLSHRQAAYWLALRLAGEESAAEDAVQEAYLTAIRLIARDGWPPEERPWFLQIVANAARRQVRGERRRRRREAAVMPQEVAAARADDMERSELAVAARRALAELEPDVRAAISLCCEQGLAQKEAAVILGAPERNVSYWVSDGLERLRRTLRQQGYAAASGGAGAVGAALAGAGLPEVPAGLAAALEKLVSGGIAVKGASAAAAAAKGGMAVKVIVGVVAAGVLAGTVVVVNGVGAGFKPAPTALSSPPATAPAEGKPAPVNEYKGMQEREEVFEFAEKPKVTKDGNKWVIVFASKGKCDATVAILDKDGKVIRHLASGVLGVNAPHPFQQNSLAQKIEWDGLKDDFSKADSAGCKAKVSLGLQAKYERDIAWAPGKGSYIEKDGKYFRTILPPPAETPPEVMSQLTSKLAPTKWGDKVPVGGWFSAFEAAPHQPKIDAGKLAEAKVKPLFAEKPPPRKVDFPPPAVPDKLFGGSPRIFVDPVTEDLYCMTQSGTPGNRVIRYIGKTGQLDTAFNNGGKGNWWNVSYMSFGLDGRIYMSCGGMGGSWFLLRVDRNWKGVPFTDKSEAHAVKPNPKIRGDVFIEGIPGPMGERGKGTHDIGPTPIADPNSGLNELLWTGETGSGNVHDPGFSVSPTGHMLVLTEDVAPEWQAKYKLNYPGRDKALQVWTPDGKLLTGDAIGAACNWGYGVHMDRDGNLYIVAGDTLPQGQKSLDGITDVTHAARIFGGHGTLMKFRGLGNGRFSTEEGGAAVPVGVSKNARTVKALWATGVSGQMGRDCNCAHSLGDLDGFARSWIPARQLCSVVVLDSNGNRVARIGRYGNVDDADPKCGGIHLVTPRGVTVSDTGLYVIDSDQGRLLKAVLTYAAEETVPLP